MKTFRIIGIIFSLVGLVALILLFFAISSTQEFIKNSEIAEGEIYDMVRRVSRSDGREQVSYYPMVRFRTKSGEIIEFQSNTTSSGMHKGQKVAVRYLPEEPQNASLGDTFSLWFLVFMAGLFALVFGGIGGALVWIGFRPIIRKRQAQNFKLEVEARITEVAIDGSFRSNGRSPYVIHAEWYDKSSNTVYTFKSDYFWYNPATYLEEEHIKVKVDAQNPKRYWMDTDFLPKSG